jgi:hypothetical protein
MLLVGITVVLSALVYLLVMAGPIPGMDFPGPQYIHIVEIRHAGDPVETDCEDSCIKLIHLGNRALENNALAADILKGGVTIMVSTDHGVTPVNITTMNGQKFPATKHDGVKTLSGSGARGATWEPGEETWILLRKNLIREGDLITVRIIHKPTNLVISEDTARV